MTTWDTSFYHSIKMRENIRLGNLNQALSHADACLKLNEKLGWFFGMAIARLHKAIALHESGRHKEAEKDLEQGIKKALHLRLPRTQFSAYLLKAHFALDRSQEQDCLAHLRKAFSLSREEGYFPHFIDRPNAMANLCIKALEAGIEVDYVQEFIRRLKIIPETSPQHLEKWPWPLKIFTLGRFGLLKDEKPLRFARKVQQRPLALLKALIALGGKEVKEEEISDFLWPESDGDAAHKAFMINLHRLRQLLGDEKVVQYQEGRLSVDVHQCWVDVWAFEHLLEEAEDGWKKGGTDKAIQLSEKALEIYQGDFLTDWVDEPFTRSLRERLKSNLIRSVDRLAGHWEKIGQFEKAAEAYQKALEVNDLIEDFYRRLMVCYGRLGKRAEALAVYRRCR
jgi:DNA-binding SARP family transcriptional activator